MQRYGFLVLAVLCACLASAFLGMSQHDGPLVLTDILFWPFADLAVFFGLLYGVTFLLER